MAGGSSKLGNLLETDSRGILIIFITVALLTLGLSFTGGPDPRTKIYILAKEETANSLSISIKAKISSETVFYTPREEFNDLDVLIHTKSIRTILIADFPFIWETEELFQSFLEATIVPVERVIVVKSFENCKFASEVIARLPQKTRIMSEMDICDEIRGMARDTGRSYSSYEFFLKTTAVSSLALVGVGAAFCGCRTSCGSRILESGSKSLLRGVAEGIVVSGSIFILIKGFT